jgi:hypothetical protein
MDKNFKILAWDMFDKRYVGNVNREGTWFDFAIIITKYPNKTYTVDTRECGNIDSDVNAFEEPTYNEFKLYSEHLTQEYRSYVSNFGSLPNENYALQEEVKALKEELSKYKVS